MGLLALVVLGSMGVSGGRAGSLYSVFGLGENAVLSGAQFRALGGGGIALPEGLSVNPFNPAASVPFPLTCVSGTFLYESTGLQTRQASGRHNYSMPVAFDFHVPVAGSWALAAGFRPVTLRTYRLRGSGSFRSYSFAGEAEVGFRQIREGRGGVQALALDLSHLFGRRWSVGAGLRLLYGKLDDSWRVDFERADFRSSEDQYSLHVRGTAAALGIMVNPLRRLYVGGFYQTRARLQGERRGESRYVSSDTVRQLKTDYPAIWGVGQALSLGESWLLVLDFLRQDWSGWQLYGGAGEGAKSWSHLSAGLQFTPKAGQYSALWKKTVLRLGVYRRVWAFSPTADRHLTEHAVTAGFGFPLPESRGRLDLAFEYGRRGNRDEYPVQETFLRFGVTFVGAEKWFVRGQ